MASCQRGEPPVLKVGFNVWPGYETLFLAEQRGYYRGFNVKLIQFPSSSEVVRNYRNGAIDVAALTADETLYLAESGLPPKIILIMDVSSGADALLSKPHIRSLADLKGKRIAVENGAVGGYLLTRALQKGGLAPKDIVLVPAEANRHESVFNGDGADAVVTFEPVRTRLLKGGARLLFSSNDIPGEICDVLAVRPRLLAEQPGAVAALLDAHFKALADITSDPAAASRMIAPREAVSPEEFVRSLDGLRLPARAENARMLAGDAAPFRDALKRLAGVMIENRLLSKPVDVAALIDPAFVEGGNR